MKFSTCSPHNIQHHLTERLVRALESWGEEEVLGHGHEEVDAAVLGDVDDERSRRRRAELVLQAGVEVFDAHALHVRHVVELRDGCGCPARIALEVVLDEVAVHADVASQARGGHEHVHGDPADGVCADGVLDHRLHGVRARRASEQRGGVLLVRGEVAVWAEERSGLAKAVGARGDKRLHACLVDLLARHEHDLAADVGEHCRVRSLRLVAARDEPHVADFGLKVPQILLRKLVHGCAHLEQTATLHAAVQHRAAVQPHT